MITSTALNRITDFLPALDFGKLWSLFKVAEPVRPIPLKLRDKPVAMIAWDDAVTGGWAGVVYSSQDGQRLVFVSTEKACEAREDNTRYLTVPPMEYVETATRLSHSKKKGLHFYGLYSDIEKLQDKTKSVSPQDRAWADRCINADGSGSAPAEKNTLG